MTTDITDLAQSLKAAAEKASGGDWVKESGDGWDATCSNDDQANSGFIIAHFVGPDSEANREFVQLANPANIRALVEALEKAQAKNALVAGGIEATAKLHERIAELESRTVTVSKSDIFNVPGGETYVGGEMIPVDTLCLYLAEHGIKWEAE
ncbi:ead/Ea22-like family protein [Raoultella terrigena]